MSNLISPDEASKRFRKAERARTSSFPSCSLYPAYSLNSSILSIVRRISRTGRHRTRTRYVYPPSSSSSPGRSRSRSRSRSPTRALPLPARLRSLQAELTALEAELEDPSNPALQARAQDGEGVDPGEMIRGLVDVRRRLEKVRRGREGRGRLVGVIVGEGGGMGENESENESENEGEDESESGDGDGDGDGDDAEHEHGSADRATGKGGDARRLVEMDKRVGELEKLVGSVSATLDEVSALFLVWPQVRPRADCITLRCS